MAYGNPLGVTAPTVSVTLGPLYATRVNEYLAALKNVVEQHVTPGGMDMTDDLSFYSGGTYQSVVDLFSARFEVQTDALLSAVSYPAALYFSGTDGNFYVNDAAGNQIQITSAGGVNASTTGGITGAGYGTGGVEVNWSSGNAAYSFFSASGTYADVVCDDLKLSDGSGNFVSFIVPSISADYTVTWPTAVPAAANTVMVMSTGGVISNDSTVEVETLTTSGVVTAGDTITAQQGVVASVNKHVTVSGTGRFKHGEITAFRPGSSFSNTGNVSTDGSGYISDTATVNAAIELPVGARLKAVAVYVLTSGLAGTRTMHLRSLNVLTGTSTSLANDTTTTTSAFDTLAATGLTQVLADLTAYHVTFTGEVGDRIYAIGYVYDQP